MTTPTSAAPRVDAGDHGGVADHALGRAHVDAGAAVPVGDRAGVDQAAHGPVAAQRLLGVDGGLDPGSDSSSWSCWSRTALSAAAARSTVVLGLERGRAVARVAQAADPAPAVADGLDGARGHLLHRRHDAGGGRSGRCGRGRSPDSRKYPVKITRQSTTRPAITTRRTVDRRRAMPLLAGIAISAPGSTGYRSVALPVSAVGGRGLLHHLELLQRTPGADRDAGERATRPRGSASRSRAAAARRAPAAATRRRPS